MFTTSFFVTTFRKLIKCCKDLRKKLLKKGKNEPHFLMGKAVVLLIS